MRRTLLVTLLVLIITGAMGGSARAQDGGQTTLLISASGTPVGGQWQRWMNDSFMPTYNGSIELIIGFNGHCGPLSGALGCTSWPAGFAAPAQVQVANGPLALERRTLLYEQAHVIDFAILTDRERLELLTLWRKRVPAGETVDQFWWQGESDFWGQPVMGEWFADDYSLCALHRQFTWALMDREGGNWVGADSYPVYSDFRQTTLVEDGPPKKWHNELLPATRGERYWLHAQQKSCGLIRTWIERAA